MKQVVFYLLIGGVLGAVAEVVWGVVANITAVSETLSVATRSGIMVAIGLFCLILINKRSVSRIAVPIILVVGGMWIGIVLTS